MADNTEGGRREDEKDEKDLKDSKKLICGPARPTGSARLLNDEWLGSRVCKPQPFLRDESWSGPFSRR